ncbi:MAG TPA: hypothetical protein VFF11_04995, partial [Candidatus Binatia bacterium]|nr:hypothetical protein [Candidatus Binatia bacterium]
PPVLAGLFVWLSRMANLSKVQTATVCLVVAAAPVLWQWHQRQAVNTQLKQAETSLTASRSERDSLQTELQELREQSSRLKTTLADTTKTAAQREDEARRFADWKKHIRSQLLSDDYQWPEDSPFVRIPKKLVPQLNIGSPVLQSGVIKQEARELLGLTPQERERAEAALHEYFSKMNHLISSSLYETNRPTFVFVPGNAIASQVFEIPALGDTVKQCADELESVLHQDLGDERWQLVKDELESYSSGGLRQMLNLDASDRAQELAVWIQEQNGQLKAGYAWGDHTGRSSSSGLVLSNFLPNAVFAPGINTVEDYMGIHQYSTQLTEPALAWLRQQAETRLENQPTNRGGQ